MEPPPDQQPRLHNNDFSSSTVDTSRPFSSVKEAVAIFGERLLLGQIYSSSTPSPNPFSISSDYSPSPMITREPSWRFPSPTPPSPIQYSSNKEEENNNNIMETVRKLEAELEKTKAELKMLKERGSETEVAIATLNAELHKNMSKLAQAEAAAAGKQAAAAMKVKTVKFDIGGEEIKEEEKKKSRNNDNEYIRRKIMEDYSHSQTLAQIISLGENDHHLLFGGQKVKNKKKKKPIIPLVGDLLFFRRRKASSTHNHQNNNPLDASPF